MTIDDELLRRAKREAVTSGRTLGPVLEDALRDSLSGRPASRQPFRLRLVTSGGSQLRDGVDIADNAATRDLMDRLR